MVPFYQIIFFSPNMSQISVPDELVAQCLMSDGPMLKKAQQGVALITEERGFAAVMSLHQGILAAKKHHFFIDNYFDCGRPLDKDNMTRRRTEPDDLQSLPVQAANLVQNRLFGALHIDI